MNKTDSISINLDKTVLFIKHKIVMIMDELINGSACQYESQRHHVSLPAGAYIHAGYLRGFVQWSSPADVIA
ncbi:hypothetical protein [Alkanindiges illinoisensis]|uniref:hypothetical protein n=1 Tax=Alkanindiges illinoisensis TaxID=197183 RepID=UPI00047E9AA5|nr:hypothetical protein [Alkanindiges illinoisensis]